jgi:exonuclease III
MPRQQSKIKIMHLNIQSVNHKIKELQHHIATNQIDVLSLNETWLKPHQKVRIPNYIVVRKDRPAQAGGGVLLATGTSYSNP